MSQSTPTRVLIASDHAGVDTKAELLQFLQEQGLDVVDLGPQERTAVDYPGFAQKLARAVVNGEGAWGVLICGSGIGMSIAANKVPGARAALVHEAYTARMAREHNDANIVVLGARVIGPEIMKECLLSFARTPFDPGNDGRHARRVSQLEV